MNAVFGAVIFVVIVAALYVLFLNRPKSEKPTDPAAGGTPAPPDVREEDEQAQLFDDPYPAELSNTEKCDNCPDAACEECPEPKKDQ